MISKMGRNVSFLLSMVALVSLWSLDLTCSLAAQVTIYRDRYGVPHILGETENSLFYGFGYAQAEDHLETMMKCYMKASGTLSLAFGPGPNESNIDSDFQMRLFRIPQEATLNYYYIHPRIRAAIESFVAGINAYILEHGHKMPSWIRHVTPLDVVALERFYEFKIAWAILRNEFFDTGENGPGQSNSWAVGPTKTGDGSVMVQVDVHTDFSDPFYEAHLRLVDGSIDVAGCTYYGFPLIYLGHNKHIGWGATSNHADIADIYEEQLNPENLVQYWYVDQWRDATVIDEAVEVKTSSGVVPISRKLYYSHHGPVVHFDLAENRAYSVKMSATQVVSSLPQLYLMNTADDLDEFKSAMSLQKLTFYNFMYGDVSGNTYYLYNSRCPVRSDTFDWRKPVPGWLGETEWLGIVPFEDLPQLTSPNCGFLINCNSSPENVTPDNDLVDADYPKYLLHPVLGWRAMRATQLLSQDQAFSEEEMRAFSFDNYVLVADDIIPLLERAYVEKNLLMPDPNDGTRTFAMDLVAQWDRRAEKTSLATFLFNLWFRKYRFLDPRIKFFSFPTPEEMSDDDMELAIHALDEANNFLLPRYGTIEVEWGSHHVINRGGVFPLSGGGQDLQTLHMTTIGTFEDNVGYCTHGSRYMMLMVLSNSVKAYSIMPTGESEDPASPHYNDLTELYALDLYKPAWFTEEQLTGNIESVKVLYY